MGNINLGQRTLGRYAAPQLKPTPTPGTPGYRVLYTRGDELLTPNAWRSGFDTALQRAVGGVPAISDDQAARAFGVSSTAFTCTEYRATTTASIPLMVVNPAGERLTGTFLDYTLTVAPGLIASVVRSCLLWGRTYIRKHRNEHGWPTKLEWLNPLDVLEQTNGAGSVVRYDVTMANGVTREPVAPEDMIYFQLFDPQPGGVGQSRFEVAWRHLNVEQGVVTYSAAFFLNGAQPDGMLVLDGVVNDSDFERLKTEWQRNFQGVKKSHKTAVMTNGAKYVPLQGMPKDLAMVELKDSEREDICAVFETDPILVGLKGVADALSANSTLSIAEVAHIRRVTLPFLNMLVLPALNKQWAHRDFDKRDYYTLAIDESGIEQLAEHNLQKAKTAQDLSDAAILDYNESRLLVGYPEREGYLTRDPQKALELWDKGTITLKQFSALTGAPPIPGLQDYIKYDGVPIPLQELPNLWRYKLLVAPSVYNSELITGQPLPEPVSPDTVVPEAGGAKQIESPQKPALPAPSEPTPPAMAKRAIESGTALLGRFADTSGITRIQDVLRGLLGDKAEYETPDNFHVTLCISEDCTPEMAHKLSVVPDAFAVMVGNIAQFDTPNGYAIHLVIRPDSDMINAQGGIATAIQGLGCTVSDYSLPSRYHPHVTLAYSTEPITPFEITPFALIVNQVDINAADHSNVFTWQLRSKKLVKATRSDIPLTLAVSFADNQFIRYAKRALSEALTGQGINAVWVDDSQWRYDMAQVDEWTPAAVSNILRTVDYGQTTKTDIQTGAFEQVGNDIYLLLSTENAAPLRKACCLDMQTAGLTLSERAAGVNGVRLCTIESTADLSALPSQAYTLVANNVTLYMGSEPYHTWNLRGVSSAYLSELKQWRHKVERKGVEVEFNPDVLTANPVAVYIPKALRAGVPVTSVFDTAERYLRDSVTLPSIPVHGVVKPGFEPRFAEYP